MIDIATLIEQGVLNLWIFIPTAILLGALHGLEPGHSKTMMAAFIMAIKGTVRQAVLLGISATISHSVVVWLMALVGLYFLGGKFDATATEPYFQLFSGFIILFIAIWMLKRTYNSKTSFLGGGEHKHSHHNHDLGHSHEFGHKHHEAAYLDEHKNLENIKKMNIISPEYHDAHQMAHAREISSKFEGRTDVSNSQIIMFGLTGGLIPCPASITVLLLCLQLKKFSLGFLMVFCFSIGLALTLVFSGVVAALSLKAVNKKFSGFSRLAKKAPYFSGLIIAVLASYIILHSILNLIK
jgi:nickel/cobalt exporter